MSISSESTSSTFETLLFQKRGAVAHISLDRPHVVNAYNIQMRDDFSHALSAGQDDTEGRALRSLRHVHGDAVRALHRHAV